MEPICEVPECIDSAVGSLEIHGGTAAPCPSFQTVSVSFAVDATNSSVAISLAVPPTEQELIVAQNSRLRILTRRYLDARSGSGRDLPVPEGTAPPQDDSGEQRRRYELGLEQLEGLLTQLGATTEAVERGLAPRRVRQTAAAARAAAAQAALLRLVVDIASASRRGNGTGPAAGSPTKGQQAVSQHVVDHFLATEPGKAAEVAALRAQVARLAFRTRRAEDAQRVPGRAGNSNNGSSDSSRGSSGSTAPHALDFEQLRLELAALAGALRGGALLVQPPPALLPPLLLLLPQDSTPSRPA